MSTITGVVVWSFSSSSPAVAQRRFSFESCRPLCFEFSQANSYDWSLLYVSSNLAIKLVKP